MPAVIEKLSRRYPKIVVHVQSSVSMLEFRALRERKVDFVLRHNAKQWSLKALPIDLAAKPRSIAIVTLKNRTVSPVVQLFVEHVRAVAKTMFARSGH